MRDAASRRFALVWSVLQRTPRMLAVSAAVGLAGYTLLLPNSYEASTNIQLASGAAYADEVSRLRSEPVLARAATRLPDDLVAELRQSATDTVDITALLERMIRIEATQDNGVVRLISVAGKPTSALGFANALSTAYLETANGDHAALTGDAADRLVPDLRLPTAPLTAQKQALDAKMAAALEDLVTLESRADLADALLAQENFYALAREFDSFGAIANRVEQLAGLNGERDELSATLLPNHPKMRTANDRIAALANQLRHDGQQIAQATRAAVATARQTETALRTEFEALSAASAETARADIDHTALTGSITAIPRQLAPVMVTPQAKLVAPELGGGAAGGLALLAQIGLLAMARPRARRADVEPKDVAAETGEQDDMAPDQSLFDETEVNVVAVPVASFMPAFVEAEPMFEAPVIAAEAVVEPEVTSGTPQPQPLPASEPKGPPRIVIVSSGANRQQAQVMADDLCTVLRQRGQRVAMVDAGSRLRTATAGISDLAAGRASFADVIQFDDENALTMVSWGRRATLDLDAEPVRILLMALGKLCDAVILDIGRTSTEHRPALLAMESVVELRDAEAEVA